MKTVYSNTSHPKLIKWLLAISVVIGIVLFAAYIIWYNEYLFSLYFISFILLETSVILWPYYLSEYIIDDENDTLVNSQNKKYPLHISELATIDYKENKRGKFRYLFLHDKGVGFMRINISRKKADFIVAQLTALNPSIEVKRTSYIQ